MPRARRRSRPLNGGHAARAALVFVAETLDRLRGAVQARIPTRRTAWRIAIAVPLVIVAGLAILLVDQVWSVKNELTDAHHLVPALESQLGDADLSGATDTMTRIAEHAATARTTTDGTLWRANEWLPVVGDDLAAVRQLSSALHLLASDAGLPLLEVAENPDAILPRGGTVGIDALRRAVAVIDRADAAVDEAVATVDGVDTRHAISAVVDAKHKIGRLTETMRPVTSAVGELAPMLPALLGADGPRRYAVMFQNLAENRALGGTALSFVVVSVDEGRIEIGETLPTSSSGFGDEQVIDAPPELAELFGGAYGNYIGNATVRPSFTSAAETVLANWRRHKGIELDGVLSLDPVALSYLLRATDPIRLSTGDLLTSDTAVQLLLNEVYLRYAVNGGGDQDALYAEAARATAERVMGGDVDPVVLAQALGQGWSERRILFYSAHADEQARLATVGLNGEPPASDDATDRVGVYFQEGIGTKLAFYSAQKLQLGRAVCRDDGRASYRVTVELTNGLDPVKAQVVSDSVLGYYRVGNLPKGLQRMIVYLYAPPGSTIVGASVDGVPQPVGGFRDGDHPVDRQRISLPAGATGTVQFDLVAAQPGDRALEAQVSPMVSPTVIDTVPLDCADAAAG